MSVEAVARRGGSARWLGAAPSLVAFRRSLTSRKSILASAPTKRLIPAFRTNVRGTMGRAGTTARTSRSPSRPRICGQPRGVGLAPVGGGRSATRHSRRVPLRFPACQTANANLSARWRSARSAPSRRLLFLRRRSLVKNGRPAAPMDRSRFSPALPRSRASYSPKANASGSKAMVPRPALGRKV